MICIPKIFCNRHALPLFVTFRYIFVTVKNSISRYNIVYSNSICNDVTRNKWSRNRTHILVSEIYTAVFSHYIRYISNFYLYIITLRLKSSVTKNVTKIRNVTGFFVTVTGGCHV